MSFGKGSFHPSEHSSRRDPVTGALVHQLTAHPSINHPTYFLQSSFTSDGRSLLFTSYRTGQPQLFEINAYPDGRIRQLTEGPAIHPFSPAIHPDGASVFFVREGGVWVIDRETLREDLIFELARGQLGECSLGDGGRWITAAAKCGPEQGIVAGRSDGAEWRFHRFPRIVIHPQFHPLEPEWIEFAADPAPRMHRIHRDGSGLECLYQNDNDEFVVHETFLGRANHLVYTVWPTGLWRMDWHTRRRACIIQFNAWHITPNRAGTQVLCDTNHPDLGLFLIDVATGTRRHLCLSGATNGGSQWKSSRYAMPEDFAAARSVPAASGALSWMENSTDTVYGPQWSHPHPSFSHDERHVAFASDRTGHTQVYVVDVE